MKEALDCVIPKASLATGKHIDAVFGVVKGWHVEEPQMMENEHNQAVAEEVVADELPVSLAQRRVLFIQACRQGNSDRVRSLLHSDPRLLTIRDPVMKRNGFLWACAEAREEIVGLLLGENEAAVSEARDIDGMTAFLLAAKNGRLPSVQILSTDPRIMPQISSVDSLQRTALHLACSGRFPETVTFLLSLDLNYDSPDHLGRSPLHIAAENGAREIVSALLAPELSGRVDVNRADVFGESPLFVACDRGHLDVVREFLKHRGRLRMRDKNDQQLTCLDVAAEEIAELLGGIWDEQEVKPEPAGDAAGKREPEENVEEGPGKKIKREPES